MAYTVSNIVIGDATVYIASVSSEAVPTSAVAYGSAWGGNWVDVGATIGGATWNSGGEVKDIEIDQENAAVYSVPVKEEHTFTLNLAESTLANVQRAMGIGTLTTGSTENTLTFGSTETITTRSIGIEGLAPGSTAAANKYRRVVIHNARPEPGFEYVMQKDNESIIAVTFKALIDSTETAGNRLLKIMDEV